MSDLELPSIVFFQPVAGKLGFPEINGPLIYLPSCNLHCDYCLNTKIVNGELSGIGFEGIEKHLKEFNESFVFISGGEPCLHNKLPNLVRRVKSIGVKVGISTNGTRFNELKSLIENDGVDFVAMDIKLDFTNKAKCQTIGYTEDMIRDVFKSISLMNSLVQEGAGSGFGQEFRTTLYPPFVSKSDIENIATFLDKDSVWILQQFRPRKGLLGGDLIAEVKPYADETLYNWLETAKVKIPKTFLRWP